MDQRMDQRIMDQRIIWYKGLAKLDFHECNSASTISVNDL